VAEHPRKELAPGLTYRQLDHWTRRGLLHPDNSATPGSGHRRVWSESEMTIARAVGELRLLGMELEPAFRMARANQPPDTARVPCGLGWPG
jgi:DNA-binding transcriptional MerR regulator